MSSRHDVTKAPPEAALADDAPLKTAGPSEAARHRRSRRVRAANSDELVPALKDGEEASANLPQAFLTPGDPERSRYLREVAEGGMGIVNSAFDTLLLRRFARKTMLHPANDAPDLARRFIEEAQITAQLDHPGIVPVHDLGLNAEDGKLYFTMKLVDGETLASVFARLHQQPFSGTEIERVLRIFLKVCDAVAFAHSRGVVHRDLKPDNIMVGSHGQVYVMDWGIALLLIERIADLTAPALTVSVGTRRDEPEVAAGTPAYMAPEQALGFVSEQGPATDVYGLGAILYDLLTGNGPHAAMTPGESCSLAKNGVVARPETRSVWPTLPPGLCAIAMKALSFSPSDRHRDVEELKQEVEEFLRGGGWFETQSFEAGAEIVREGEAANAAYIVTHGSCEVFRVVLGKRSVLRRVGPGEIFGETGLLTRRPRVATVAALEPVRVLVITPEALDRELDRNGWLRILVEALANRFRELDQAHLSSAPTRS